jgi:uncharacterized protein (TIGR02246 family)
MGADDTCGQEADMALTSDDHLEIQTLAARYSHAVDSGDGETFAATFTESGVLDAGALVVEGRPALARFAEGLPRSHRAPRHVATNLLIDGDGDRATLRAYVQMYALTGDPPSQQVVASGRYVDELVRRDGRWLFERRVFTRDA